MLKKFLYILNNGDEESVPTDKIVSDIKSDLVENGMSNLVVKAILEKLITIFKNRKNIKKSIAVKYLTSAVSSTLRDILKHSENNDIFINPDLCNIFVVVGGNGVGKTSFTAKLAHLIAKNGYNVCVGTIDHKRHGGHKQLEKLVKNSNISVINFLDYSRNHQILSGMISSVADKKDYDILLLDTPAISNDNDIVNLKKLLHGVDIAETLYVVDAMYADSSSMISNLIREKIGITGLIMSKFDGAVNINGVINSTITSLKPIYYYTYGEKMDNIAKFQTKSFIDRVTSDINILYSTAFESETNNLRNPVIEFKDISSYFDSSLKSASIIAKINNLSNLMTSQEKNNPIKISYERKIILSDSLGIDMSFIDKMILFYKKLSDKTKSAGMFKCKYLEYDELVD